MWHGIEFGRQEPERALAEGVGGQLAAAYPLVHGLLGGSPRYAAACLRSRDLVWTAVGENAPAARVVVRAVPNPVRGRVAFRYRLRGAGPSA